MPRPKRPRHVFFDPKVKSFRPEGIDGAGEIILSIEEFEAVRIIDYQGMDQSQASEIMNVSRQTVGRILKAGRLKIATALVEGQCIRVQGGCYRMKGRGRRGRGRGPGPAGCGPGHRRNTQP